MSPTNCPRDSVGPVINIALSRLVARPSCGWTSCWHAFQRRAPVASNDKPQLPGSGVVGNNHLHLGTTGQSKGIMLSQRNLVSNAAATVAAHQRGPSDLQLCFLPLSHVFAAPVISTRGSCRGHNWRWPSRARLCLADCRQVRPTVINGVPYFYQRVYRQWQHEGRTYSLPDLLGGRVRECCCGGAPLSGELSDAFDQQGVLLLPGYGLTEASPVIAVSTSSQYKRGPWTSHPRRAGPDRCRWRAAHAWSARHGGRLER